MANITLNDCHISELRGVLLEANAGSVGVGAITPLTKAEVIRSLNNHGVNDSHAGHIDQSRKHYRDLWTNAVNAQVSAVAHAAPAVDLSSIESSITALNTRLDSVANSIPVTPKIDADIAVADAVDKAFGKFRKIIESTAGAAEIIADAVSVRVIDRRSALDVFGVDIRDRKGDPVLVDIYNDAESPEADDSYIWPVDVLRWALIAQDAANSDVPFIQPNVWFAGDRGTGKTQFAQQFAARTGRGFVRINFDRHLERLDFIGSKGLENGQTVWQDGTFLKAFKRTGCVILLDEFGFANPANVANLQALLEPNAAVTYDGFTHRRAKGVVVFAADNSTGNRDDSGRFKGVQEQNSALLDRFGATVRFSFLPPSVESGLIQRRTGCAPELADSIVRVLSVARAETEKGEIIDAPSLRQAFALATGINAGIDPATVWQATITNKSPSESRSALDAIALSFFAEIQSGV
jgi:cobaltochelatase CobS